MDEFNVRLASNAKTKKYSVFKLHKDDKVAWTEAKMRRENDYQPWQIKFGSGRTSRRFKATKDGGVGDNASYYVFYKSNDRSDTYEVCPVDEWFSVSATQRYKTLTAEEAELQFEKRHKIFNHFSVMKKGGENDDDGPTGSGNGNFKVSELDDWDESCDDDRSDEEGGEDDESKKKNRKKKNVKKEEPDDAPEEGLEDSDEGDFEQREVDYMSDSSSESDVSEADKKDVNDVRGIAEEQALRDLLSSEEEEEEDADNPNKKAIKSSGVKREGDDNSDDSSDSDDFDVDDDQMDTMLMSKGLPAQLSPVKQETEQQQRQQTQQQKQQSTSVKRKVSPDPPAMGTAKRPCVEVPANSQEKLVEDLIKKYLTRKPMTLKNLLKDIKSKLRRMDGTSQEMDTNLVNMIATIMKRLGPDKQRINDQTYFSIKN